jgi:carboxylesterase
LTEVEKAIIIGHSMGGLVTLNLAAEHAYPIDSIVVAATALRLTTPFAQGRPLHFLAPLVARVMKKQNLAPVYADPELAQYDTNYPWVPTDAAISLFKFGKATHPRLPEIDLPALIIQSRNDSTVLPETADIIYNGISTPAEQKRVVWFEKTEHEMFRDCEREAAIQAVADYVQERIALEN